MLLLKLIAIGIATGAGLLQIKLQPQTPSSRNRNRARLQRCLIGLMILGAVVAAALIILDDRQSASQIKALTDLKRTADSEASLAVDREKAAKSDRTELKQEIAKLQSRLDPFLSLATARYPGVGPEKALERLAQDIKELKQRSEQLDARTQRLAEQARLIRTIDGNIQCIFAGNWKNHPGTVVPISWNKSQTYARVFEKSATEMEAILFSLENMSMAKLPDGNLKVNLEIRAKSGVGPLGQKVDVLKKYTHLVVYVPFIDQDATVDSRITLKEITGSLYVNGEKKSKLSETQSFEIPIQKGKTLGFQLNKTGLFAELAE